MPRMWDLRACSYSRARREQQAGRLPYRIEWVVTAMPTAIVSRSRGRGRRLHCFRRSLGDRCDAKITGMICFSHAFYGARRARNRAV